MDSERIGGANMKEIKHFMLPEHTNNLYKEEAISSISLTREVADKINEIVDELNESSKIDLEWKQEQEGIIRKGVLYMKDNLLNTLHDLLELYAGSEDIKNMIGDIVINGYSALIQKTKGIVSPQMFEAVGDGITDDTIPFQAAIDYAVENNCSVYVPEGEYRILYDLNLKNVKHIYGNGPGSVLKCYGALTTSTDADDVVTIENLKMVNMSNKTLLSIHRRENTGKGFSDFVLQNVNFHSGSGSGTLLSLFGNGQSTISHCLFDSTYDLHMDEILSTGITISSDSSIGVANINITDCEFNRLHKSIDIVGDASAPDIHCGFRIINNLFVGGHYGIEASFCDSVTIEHNMIDMIWYPIRLTMVKSPKIRENYVAVNQNTSNSDAIVITAPRTQHLERYLDISHNYISSYAAVKGNGIVINAVGTLVQYGTISNNIFKLLNVGIVLNGTSSSYYVNNLMINNNTITESEMFISLTEYCLRNTISDNIVEANVKEFVNDYTRLFQNDYRYNRYGLQVSNQRGTFNGKGDGQTSTFYIPHNLFRKPRWVNATCQTSVIHGNSMAVTYDDENVRIWFEKAPESGKDVIINWEVCC